MNVVVVTPEATVVDEKADFLALPLFDGEIGIAGGHAPMIGRLGFGEMRIETGGNTVYYYVEGGFVQVNADVVSVLTNRAIVAHRIEPDKAKASLDAAMKQPAHSDEALDARERAENAARAQLRIAQRAGK